METFVYDVRYAIRTLIKAPAFTLAAIAALTLGIGANTAIFSVVNAVLLKPLSAPDPGRVVFFMSASPQGSGTAASPAKFAHWRQQTSVIEEPSAFNNSILNYTGAGLVEQFRGGRVSADFFKLFDAPMYRGRTFSADSPGITLGSVPAGSLGVPFTVAPNTTGAPRSLFVEAAVQFSGVTSGTLTPRLIVNQQ